MRAPECEMITLWEEIKQIKMQAAKGDKVNFESHANLCPMNENETTVHKMKLWVKKLECLEQKQKKMLSKAQESLEHLDSKEKPNIKWRA